MSTEPHDLPESLPPPPQEDPGPLLVRRAWGFLATLASALMLVGWMGPWVAQGMDARMEVEAVTAQVESLRHRADRLLEEIPALQKEVNAARQGAEQMAGLAAGERATPRLSSLMEGACQRRGILFLRQEPGALRRDGPLFLYPLTLLMEGDPVRVPSVLDEFLSSLDPGLDPLVRVVFLHLDLRSFTTDEVEIKVVLEIPHVPSPPAPEGQTLLPLAPPPPPAAGEDVFTREPLRRWNTASRELLSRWDPLLDREALLLERDHLKEVMQLLHRWKDEANAHRREVSMTSSQAAVHLDRSAMGVAGFRNENGKLKVFDDD